MVLHRPVELAALTGMYGPPQRCKRKTKQWQLVCPNVFGLEWSQRLRAMMDVRSLCVPINWTVWKRPLPVSGFESVGETHCHLFFRQQTGQESHFLDRDFRWWPRASERDSFRSCTTPPMRCEPICWPGPRPPHFGACAPVVVLTNS